MSAGSVVYLTGDNAVPQYNGIRDALRAAGLVVVDSLQPKERAVFHDRADLLGQAKVAVVVLPARLDSLVDSGYLAGLGVPLIVYDTREPVPEGELGFLFYLARWIVYRPGDLISRVWQVLGVRALSPKTTPKGGAGR